MLNETTNVPFVVRLFLLSEENQLEKNGTNLYNDFHIQPFPFELRFRGSVHQRYICARLQKIWHVWILQSTIGSLITTKTKRFVRTFTISMCFSTDPLYNVAVLHEKDTSDEVPFFLSYLLQNFLHEVSRTLSLKKSHLGQKLLRPYISVISARSAGSEMGAGHLKDKFQSQGCIDKYSHKCELEAAKTTRTEQETH